MELRTVQVDILTYSFVQESTRNQLDWKPIGQVELPTYIIAPEITWKMIVSTPSVLVCLRSCVIRLLQR